MLMKILEKIMNFNEYQKLAARTARMDIDPNPEINKKLTIATFALRINW